MSSDLVIDVQTIDHPGMDAAVVYDKLRRFTPGRASFLFEALDPDHAESRYSVVGYRARQGETVPPGVDAYRAIAEEMAGAEQPATFAEAMARASVGYMSPGVSWLANKVPLFEDEGPSAQLVVGFAVMVFDHQENTVTVAGPAKGYQVERIIHELGKGEEIGPAKEVTAGAKPARVQQQFEDDMLRRRVKKAKAFLDGPVSDIVLSQVYACPGTSSDPFDVYRAWRGSTDAPHGYFVDFGESPMSPPLQLFGVARNTVALTRRGEEGPGMGVALHEAMPHPSTTGNDPVKAAKLLRKIENTSRVFWGGTVGYACPGGEGCWVLADEVVYVQGGAYFVARGAKVDGDTELDDVTSAMAESAAPALAAIAAA